MRSSPRTTLALSAGIALGAATLFAARGGAMSFMGGLLPGNAGSSASSSAQVVGLSAVSGAQRESSPDPAAIIARIEARQPRGQSRLAGHTIEELMREHGVPGLSVAVVHDYEVHWAKAYGVADAETGRLVDTATMFQAASISKPIAGLVAMRLVQDGRFRLDDDINTILRSWRVPDSEHTRGRPVTPRSLMSHTSGADDGYGFPGYPPGTPVPTLVQILHGERPSNRGPVLFARPPYRAYKYSGGGWVVMQLALADLTARPFDELARELLLEPLGMRNSTFAQPMPGAPDANLARAHGGRGQTLAAPWHLYPEQAAAGLWTTPSDLARVAIEVQRALRDGSGRVLDGASARALTTPVGVGPFAAGFVVSRVGEGWYFAHSGDNYGFQGALRAHLRHGYGMIVLGNNSNAGTVAEELMIRAAHAYDWDAVHAPLRR